MFSTIQILLLRLKLLVRQKLGLVAAVTGVLAVVLSHMFSQASFLSPARIFWDFCLGSFFVLQSALTLYLSTQLLAEERNRRTLHLLLASGVPRYAWLVGNTLSIWVLSAGMGFLWLGVALLSAKLLFTAVPVIIVLQAQLALAAELLLVTFLGVLLSLIVRPVLALGTAASLFLFLHSVGSIERIFSDAESGHLIDTAGITTMLKLARFLPPLEWFDLRVFVSYQDSVSWSLVGGLVLMGVLWAALLAVASILTFERMDL
jgi:ABC-type Na+ efflux pump permease subunit